MSRTRARTTTLTASFALAVLAASATTLPAATAAAPGQPGGLLADTPNSTTTVLSWDREPSAVSYLVEVDEDSGFRSPEFSQTTTNVSAVPSTVLKAGTNHWRVRATNRDGTSEWAVGSFVRPDPLVPQLQAPADNAILSQPDDPPLLQWGSVQGAKSYTVEIDDAEDFIGAKKWTTSTTSLVPDAALQLGRWYWRITAVDSGNQLSAPSTPRSFTIPSLPAPRLVSPVNSANELVEDVVLDWAPVPGASSYELQVATNSGFESSDIIEDVRSIRGTRWSPPRGLDNDQYYWRVRAVDPGGAPSAWAASPNNFDRQWPDRPWPVAPAQPGFPEYPSDFDTEDPGHRNHPFFTSGTYQRNYNPDALPPATMDSRAPYVQWTPVQHASYYELNLSTDPNFSLAKSVTCQTAGTTYTLQNYGREQRCRLTGTAGESSTWYWRVRPIDGPGPAALRRGINGLWSPAQKFTWTTPVTPADTERAPQPVTGLRIALDGLSLAERRGCDLLLDTTSNMSRCPEVPTTPVFSWEASPDAAYYMLYVSYDRNFTNLVHKALRRDDIPSTSGTNYAFTMHGPEPQTLADNTSGVPYYWHVRPCTISHVCGPDPVSSATSLAVNAFKKVSPQVQTTATPATVDTSEVTFAWEDYHRTNQQHWVTRDGAPSWSATYHRRPTNGFINPRDLSNQSAMRYRIRVATDENFNNVIDDQLVDQTTYTAVTKLYPEGPKYWRVTALDNAGNELSASTTRSFVKASATVPTLTPAANSSVAGTTPFRWKGLPFTGEYEVEVSRNDPQFSSVNRQFLAKTWATAYTPLTPLPVSDQPYYWRVRRVDASKNPTTWSQGVPFRVASTGVVLVGPGDGSTQAPNGPLLSWQPLTEATTYLVEVKDATGRVVASQVTPATGYAPVRSLAAGRYTWSVTARNSDGRALAAPSTRSFVVDTTLVATSAPVIAHDTARPQVGSVLSVAPLTWNRPGVRESYVWLRNGSAIRGATSSTYTATEADFDKQVSVRVKGSLPSHADTEVTSAPVLIGPGAAVVASAPPQISGTAQVGQRLTSTAGSWPDRTKVTYEWLRNGSPITGATASSYTLQAADATTRVSVRVTGTLAGRAPGTATSSTVSVGKARSTTTATVSPKTVKRGAKVRMTVTVKVPGVARPTGKLIVKVGKKKIKTVKLKAGKKGKVTFTLPAKKLRKKGKYRLVVQYKGTTKIGGSKSKKVVLTVL
ncbi:Ig-like domain repeat protein [Nocardioides sp. Y6]|uniref:Ig-like domain repeat protein n=1 Tax=Nocardioides malaquae TaxID=2773426 RepID=A0ABR9RP10_9ACTN|nr:Ig-like domain repeat protein [Nocardioides malaquae]MBE7323288.1 Ig-like domain repeat protein [Nocardioides malaquae]